MVNFGLTPNKHNFIINITERKTTNSKLIRAGSDETKTKKLETKRSFNYRPSNSNSSQTKEKKSSLSKQSSEKTAASSTIKVKELQKSKINISSFKKN